MFESETQKKAAILGGVGASVILILSLLIIVIVQICTIAPLKKERAQAQARLNQILQDKAAVTSAIDAMQYKEFLEEYAREELGLGKPGTVKYKPK